METREGPGTPTRDLPIGPAGSAAAARAPRQATSRLGTLALTDMIDPQRAATARLGTSLTLLGLLGLAVLGGMDLVVSWLAGSGSVEALAALDGITATPLVTTPLAVLLPGLVAGLAIVAQTLHRQGTAPAWVAILLPMTTATVFVGLSVAPLAIGAAAALLIALGALAACASRPVDPSEPGLTGFRDTEEGARREDP